MGVTAVTPLGRSEDPTRDAATQLNLVVGRLIHFRNSPSNGAAVGKRIRQPPFGSSQVRDEERIGALTVAI